MENNKCDSINIEENLIQIAFEKLKLNPEKINNLSLLDDQIKVSDQLYKGEEFQNLKDFRSLRDLEKGNGQIVEFECLIQDFLNSDIYTNFIYKREEVLKSVEKEGSLNDFKKNFLITKYKENLQDLENKISDDFEYNQGDRSVYYGIPIPRVVHSLKESVKKSEQVDEFNEKGSFIELDLNENMIQIDKNQDLNDLYEDLKKKKIKSFNFFNYSQQQNLIEQFPCVLNFYQSEETQLPQMNEVIKGKGVLFYSSEVHEQSIINTHYSQTYHSFLVPRIHVLEFERKKTFSSLKKCEIVQSEGKNFAEIKNKIFGYLNEITSQDKVLSNFILFSLVTSIIQEVEGNHFGKQTLNIIVGKQKNFGQILSSFLAKFLPESIYLPLNLETLDKIHFSPHKNEETDILETGYLQIPKANKSLLIIDENQLQEGKIEHLGMKNILILKHLILNQQLQITNQYFNLQIPLDLSVLVISEAKTFLPFDIQIKAQNQNFEKGTISEQLQKILKNDESCLKELEEMKNFILFVKNKVLEFNIDEECKETITQHFVRVRDIQSKLNQDVQKILTEKGQFVDPLTLNRWILLSKIQGCLNLRQKSTKEDFQFIIDLEEKRLNTLK